jgi:hypothetical protein
MMISLSGRGGAGGGGGGGGGGGVGGGREYINPDPECSRQHDMVPPAHGSVGSGVALKRDS